MHVDPVQLGEVSQPLRRSFSWVDKARFVMTGIERDHIRNDRLGLKGDLGLQEQAIDSRLGVRKN